MSRGGHVPFEEDIDARGAYQYTDGTRYSARIANERYGAMILGAANFAGKRVLDVGSGDGTYTAELARRSGASSVLGIEPAANAVETARASYGDIAGLSFEAGTSASLLEGGAHFDIAVYRGVLHHVPAPEAEIARAVRLADTLIFLEPNGWNLLMKTVEKVSPYHRAHQERSFTPARVGNWIARAGGKVLSNRYFGLVPYFCPDALAKAGKRAEPLVEGLPCVRAMLCGQYLLVAQGCTDERTRR